MKIFFTIVIYLIFSGCIYEPPPTFYEFNIANYSENDIIIISRTIKEDNTSYDTVKVNAKYHRRMVKLHCYNDYYHDSLLYAFFKRLEIYSKNKPMEMNVFNRINWKEDLNNLESAKGCKSGLLIYELAVRNNSFMSHPNTVR